ncbi:MAG: hypothetical protein V1739_05660 [Candidatus Omnitrophota bacterium]
MNKGLKFLSVSSLIFKVLAWISAVFFLVVSLIVLLGAGGDTPRVAGLIFLLGGAIYFLILFTAAELIKLVISNSGKLDRLGDLLEGKRSL